MQHIIRYITILFTIVLFVQMPAWAETDLKCATQNQDNSDPKAPWVCPLLPYNDTEMNAVLSDVDVETGRYTCEYQYATSGVVATSCDYVSEGYKTHLKATRDTIKQSIKGAIDGSGGSAVAAFDSAYYSGIIGTLGIELPLQAATEMKALAGLWEDEKELRDKLHARIQKIISGVPEAGAKKPQNLREYIQAITKSNGQVVNLHTSYLDDMDTTQVKDPKDALNDSYKYFVKPYTPKVGKSRDINHTFSRFIINMVTLDDDVIKGYSDTNGSLVLLDTWSLPNLLSKEIMQPLKKHFGEESNSSHDMNTDSANISDWHSIFTQKIWGFYYNLQRRLDLGYDVIATQLLFIMMVFFAMSMAARGGARYITNRENGHSSGEVKINEASIMKTLGILATVFVFYISVPTTISDTITNTTEISDLESHEMRTNSSLAKYLIRYAMNEGATFGTMMSDLGTDAFLHYVVNKQGIDNSERNNVIESMLSMTYYFPAYQIVNTCRMQYGTTDIWATSANNSVGLSTFFNKHYKEDIKLTNQNSVGGVQLVGVSDRLCRKMYARTEHKLEEVAFDFESLLAMIKKDMYVRMNATYSIVHNHIQLQRALGWMNAAAIPYTYFMMKNQHLFYETSVNYDEIEKKTRLYANNLGLRSSKDSLNDTLWAKDLTESKLRVSDAQSAARATQDEYTRFAVYNFLPGFTSIRNEILQRMQSLYSDILRLRKKDDTEKLKSFKKLLHSMISKSQQYYKNSKINIDAIRKHLDSGIPDGNLDGQDPVELHQAFIKISYFVAMGIWKSGFIIVFLSAIAMIVGLKIVLYVINVMVHFFISPFIVVWAFATSTDGGMSKIKNYLRDTLIYMLYPTIIVVGVFLFIFAYELFYSMYGFITSMLIAGQEANISNAIIAANPTSYTKTDGEMGYLAIYALKDITEILIDLLSVYVAFLTINKFPELVLKMMGVGDSAVIMLPQASEAIQSKGGGSVNPLSR